MAGFNPITEVKDGERKVYLPAGNWFDGNTGTKTGTVRILFIVCSLRNMSLGNTGGLVLVCIIMVNFGVDSGFSGHLMNYLSASPI